MKRHAKLVAFKSILVLCAFAGIVVYGAISNRLFEALLVIIMWLQLELGLRQYELQKKDIPPQLVARLKEKKECSSKRSWEFIVRNVGRSTAYCVFISLIVTDRTPGLLTPYRNEVWKNYIRPQKLCVDIPPDREETIAYILDPLALDKCMIEILYTTVHERFGVPMLRSAYFIIHVLKTPIGSVEGVTISTAAEWIKLKRPPGLLMNSIEDVIEFAKLLIFTKRLRKATNIEDRSMN